MHEKTQGVLLHAFSYLGESRILKVFTPELGLVSLIAKGKKWTPLTSPFCLAEWVFRKKGEEIHPLKDATLLDPLLDLRSNYETLSAAGSIAAALLRSQLPSKRGDELYALLLAYLKKLPTFARPEILSMSFRLKLLLWEGLLSLQPTCSLCASPAEALSEGESYCQPHAPLSLPSFTKEEFSSLCALALSRQFSALATLSPSPSFSEKIDLLFEERLIS